MFIERPLSEADVKLAVKAYLQFQQNMGKLMYLRLNSGSFILSDADGNFRRRVQGAQKGTADFVVFQSEEMFHTCRVTFLECKKSNWKPSRKPGETEQAQRDFAEQTRRVNARYFVVRDASELTEILG